MDSVTDSNGGFVKDTDDVLALTLLKWRMERAGELQAGGWGFMLAVIGYFAQLRGVHAMSPLQMLVYVAAGAPVTQAFGTLCSQGEVPHPMSVLESTTKRSAAAAVLATSRRVSAAVWPAGKRPSIATA
jgi:hypothetical protein